MSSSSSSSSSSSEAVTRTVLGWSAAMMQSGVSPAGMHAFSAASAAAAEASLPSSLCATFSAVSGDIAEQLSDCLLGLGAQSVVVQEARAEGQPEQEKFGAEAGLWDSCQVLAHFPLEHNVDETVAAVQDILELPGLSFELEEVVDQEWVEQIKASYVPVQIAEGLYIVPEWSEPADPAALNIRLTPGVAFGTGEHPTTKLCLRYLAGQDLQGCSVCDYGTGSGVLAIAALLMGASSAVGTDTDPLAVRAAEANAGLNGMQGRFSVVGCGANLDDADPLLQLEPSTPRLFDVVVANILRGPLLELQPRLTAYCRPGGRLALSGILAEQAPDVVAAYSPYFEDFQVSTEGSWALVTARRKQ
uniref:ETFB lysine methyltransferase n=1 Tax=Tetradesmus obliquus TaxID=3088 RepID=A0A383VKK8_TETOB|eukprot:jgi/Sobl393_1/11265/SZX66067.1